MSSLSWQPVVPLLGLAAIAAALVGLLWVGPSFGRLGGRRRAALVAIRMLTIGLVLTMLLRPGCVTTVERQQSAVLPIVVDVSRSMELRHSATGGSRWEKLREVLAANRERLEALRERRIEPQWFGFDAVTHDLTADRLPWEEASARPDGSETDIGSALADVARRTRHQRLAGVILASDGVQNATFPEIEMMAAADLLAAVQTPLYTVALGQAADAGQSADLMVASLPDHFRGVVKTRQSIQAVLRCRGFTNRDVPVQLIVTDPSGKEAVAVTRSIRVERDEQEIPLALSFTPEQAGNYRLKVRIEPQEGEVTAANNELSAFMTIFDGGLRILYLHGDVSPESKYLVWALGSSAEIQLDDLPIFSRDRRQWPIDLSDTIRQGNYDIFILENVSAAALYQTGTAEQTLSEIARQVGQGKGLIMLGGVYSFGPGMYPLTPLADLLPIRMDAAEKQDLDAPIRKQLHIDRELKLRPTGSHFVTELTDDPAESPGLWAQLPPLSGANRWIGVKDNAQILLESDAGDPILAAHAVGGRVAALAVDSTWRWYLGGQERAHKRFWRQLMLWLVFRDGLSEGDVWINLTQRRFEPHGAVDFTVEGRTATGAAVPRLNVEARLQLPDGRTVAIPTTPGEGRVAARVERQWLDRPGLYRIEADARDADRSLGTAAAEFMVFDRDKEKSNPAGAPEQLARLSARTQAFGGRMIQPDELSRLLDEILQHPPETRIEVPQKWQLGDTPWDGAIFLIAFVASLAVEWIARKRWGLV